MPTQRFTYSDMQGYSPSVEPTSTDKIFALQGRNYVFDSSGPRSQLGNRFLTPTPWLRPQNIQGIRVHFKEGDVTFTMNGDGVWTWDEGQGGWQCLYQTENSNLQAHRWTWGYLNGLIYLCHPRVGILVYDIVTRVMQRSGDAGAVGYPREPIAIAVNNGMLSILDSAFLYWSNPSNGLDFTPALGGAGFQAIAERVSGEPIMLTSFASCILVWTTGGCMRSEYTGDTVVYRHRPLNTDVRPVNSFCVADISADTSLVLDERGLFVTKGDIPQAYSLMFNEFLIDWINVNGLKSDNRLRIEWDELRRHLYVSASLADSTDYFDECWVYYPPLDKWGQFSEIHYGIVPIRINDSARAGDYYAFCDRTGRVRIWMNTPTTESGVSANDYENLWYPALSYPAQYNPIHDATVVGSSVRAGGWNSNTQAAGSVRSGFYLEGFNVPVKAYVSGLNAEVEIGLFRPTGPNAIDEASEVLQVMIRSQPSQAAGIVPNDWADDPNMDFQNAPSQDFNDATVTYDSVSHKLKIIGTKDGVTEFTSADGVLADFTQNARYYACSVVGVWHILRVTASDPGESFQVTGGEITAASAGRIL
jgi:hypothetical protein